MYLSLSCLSFIFVLLSVYQGEPTKAREIFQKGETKAKHFGDAGFFQVVLCIGTSVHLHDLRNVRTFLH